MVTKKVLQKVEVVATVKRGRGRPRKDSPSFQPMTLDSDAMQAISTYQTRVYKQLGLKLTVSQTICYAIFEAMRWNT